MRTSKFVFEIIWPLAMASYSSCVKKHRKLLPEKPRGAGVMQTGYVFFSGHLKFEGLEVSERHVSPLINTSGRVLQILRATWPPLVGSMLGTLLSARVKNDRKKEELLLMFYIPFYINLGHFNLKEFKRAFHRFGHDQCWISNICFCCLQQVELTYYIPETLENKIYRYWLIFHY